MKRIAKYVLLVLAGLVLVMWVVSYWYMPFVSVSLTANTFGVEHYQARGVLSSNFIIKGITSPMSTEFRWVSWSDEEKRYQVLLDLGLEPITDAQKKLIYPDSFVFRHRTGNTRFLGSYEFYVLHIPHWLLILILIFWPTYSFLHSHSRKHNFPCCPKCDYDLRGSSDAECPECGDAIT